MKRRVSAPTTLPWRTRYTVVDRSRRDAASDEVAVGAGRSEDEPGQLGQLHAGPQGVAGQPAEAPRENDDSASPRDQSPRRHRRSREPEQEPGEDEQDGEPDRSGGAGERGEERRAEALAGCGRANDAARRAAG